MSASKSHARKPSTSSACKEADVGVLYLSLRSSLSYPFLLTYLLITILLTTHLFPYLLPWLVLPTFVYPYY